MSDWIDGTCAGGKCALTEGKQVEEAVYKMLKGRGMQVEWLSQAQENWMCGYDMIVNGSRVEIKSNEYIDHRDQIVIEISDKTPGQHRSKWMDGRADRLLFVERSTGRVLCYNAPRLSAMLDDPEQFPRWRRREYNGALCHHVPAHNEALIAETRLS